MARLGRGEPVAITDEDSEVIDRIVQVVNVLLPRGREVAILCGLYKTIGSISVAREGHDDSLDTIAESDDIPVPHGLLGSRASMRVGHQQVKQEKRVTIEDAHHQNETGNDRNHFQNDCSGIGNLRQPSCREDYDNYKEEDNSSDWTEDSDSDDTRTSRFAPRHSRGAAKKHKRVVPSHVTRRSTAGATLIHSPQTPSSQVQTAKPANHQAATRSTARSRMKLGCPKCPQTKRQRLELEEHMACHGGRGMHKCMTCDFATDSGASAFHHRKIHPEPSQGKQPHIKRHGKKRRSPSESESEVPPARMPSAKRNRDNGHTALRHRSQDGRFSAVHDRALAERGKRAHPFSPGQWTSGISGQGTGTDQQPITDFRCKDCQEVFVYKAHLKLHRRLYHDNREMGPS